jgi:uracil phosphoribosyltransferase
MRSGLELKTIAQQLQGSKMSISDKAFNQAVNILRALKTEFIIKKEDGELVTCGELVLAEKKERKHKARQHPRGTYTDMVSRQGLLDLDVGEVIVVDPKNLTTESVRSTTINLATKRWGAGSVTTSVNNGKIEVLRIL